MAYKVANLHCDNLTTVGNIVFQRFSHSLSKTLAFLLDHKLLYFSEM